jgi:ribosomal protein S14
VLDGVYVTSALQILILCPRQALRYIIRNLSLPPRVRAAAQLQLAQMHCYTRPTQIRNRCIEGGKGRGILRDFRMSRVCFGHQIYPCASLVKIVVGLRFHKNRFIRWALLTLSLL